MSPQVIKVLGGTQACQVFPDRKVTQASQESDYLAPKARKVHAARPRPTTFPLPVPEIQKQVSRSCCPNETISLIIPQVFLEYQVDLGFLEHLGQAGRMDSLDEPAHPG